jgi:hypothetical protein
MPAEAVSVRTVRQGRKSVAMPQGYQTWSTAEGQSRARRASALRTPQVISCSVSWLGESS